MLEGRRGRGGGRSERRKGRRKQEREEEARGGGVTLGVDDIRAAMDFISSAGADGDGGGSV